VNPDFSFVHHGKKVLRTHDQVLKKWEQDMKDDVPSTSIFS
jgi:hypothetical protein